MAKSVSELREELGAYLTKPMEVGFGNISTQQNLVATSLSGGGLEGAFEIKKDGDVIIFLGINK